MSTEDLDGMHFKHNNGWVTGNLIVNGDNPYIAGDLVETEEEYITHEFWMPVFLESVGQFTGLKDKNTHKIHEGDISWDEHYECYGVVKFDEGKFVYEWENICEDLSEVHVEVISNIFDNPNLLRSEKQ